jgi:transcriptional regulator with GAF, ATPase, and Fis domain
MIVAGIIGGRADALFVALGAIISQSFMVSYWPWIIVIAMTIALATCIYLWRLDADELTTIRKDREAFSKEIGIKDVKIEALSQERNTLVQELGTLDKVMKLDDSIFRLLPNLVSPRERENEIRRLLKKLLEDTCGTFAGDVDRAVLYLPDPRSGNEYLKYWEGYQMPPESILRSRFYVGTREVDKKRGLAGEAFFRRKILVAHIIKESHSWHADNDSYINFDETRPFPPYRAVVSVPLITGDNPTDCLGVMCFDSENATAFDSQEVQTMLQKLGARIASILSIYQRLKTIR